MRSALVIAVVSTGCLPQAWDGREPASTFVGTASSPQNRMGGGMGMMGGGFGGGVAGGAGGGGAGGPGGGAGGGMPMGGGGALARQRTAVPEATGTFAGGFGIGPVFPRGPLRSSTLATVPDRLQLVAVADDADAVFVLAQPNRRIPLPAGARPSSIAVSPNGLTAWVALRGLGSVARVTLATGAVLTVPVGAEPTGLALSPSGRYAVVATFGERTVSILDTVTLAFSTVDVGGHPRALTITNDGDLDDYEESAFVTLFYGEPLSEGTNLGRRGVVVEVGLGTSTVLNRITLAPLASEGCSPNLLSAIAENAGLLYVTHVCAMAAAPQNATQTVRAGLSVIDRTTRLEVTAAPNGSRVLRARSFMPSSMANPVAVAPFSADAVVVLAQGANEVQLSNSPTSKRVGLSPFYQGMFASLDEAEAGVPTGVVAVQGRVFVLDDTGRRVIEMNSLDPMTQATEWVFETLPPLGSSASAERRGRRHFATAEGLWSAENSVSCSSCHPDGLTDGLTWVFAAGPRQTPSLAGTFERGRAAAHRAQGWTATSDEISDVEHIVRTLAGGTGAITNASGVPLSLTNGVAVQGGVARHDGLNASSRDLVLANSQRDWIDVEAWLVSLPRPPASERLDVLAVSRGRQLFANANCAACHGGALWTVSQVPYLPSFTKNGSGIGDDFNPAVATGLRTQQRNGTVLWNPALNVDTLKVGPESVLINGQLTTIGPERITCVLRNVGTFDRADPLEVKSNGQPAQGELGFNPPSLFGLATSAPYFHHGKARTLREVFSAPYERHHQAWLPTFLESADGGVNQGEVDDLVSFLESIDEDTVPFPPTMVSDLCAY